MLLSIITINLNNAQGLKRTLESVSHQTFKDFEYIIIDGGSNDGSTELIHIYSHIISDWISEADHGIYHAQNKGTRMSTGKYLLFLNAGDSLINEKILSMTTKWLNGVDIAYGDLEIVEPGKRWIKKYSGPITFGYFLRDTLPHQASFIKRELLEKAGGFDESLSIAADWKFFLEVSCKFNATLHYFDEAIASYDYTGISSLAEGQKKLQVERRGILEKEYPRFYFELNEIKTKYRWVTASRFIRIYFAVRNFFCSDKIIISKG